jgi:hypothetical protein
MTQRPKGAEVITMYYVCSKITFEMGAETRPCPKQRGAAEARRAHNPEDTGSKPVVAIFLIFSLKHTVRTWHWNKRRHRTDFGSGESATEQSAGAAKHFGLVDHSP